MLYDAYMKHKIDNKNAQNDKSKYSKHTPLK